LLVQFGHYVSDLVRGDLGTSFRFGDPVNQLVVSRFVNTLKLVIPSFALAIGLAVPLGVLSARRRGRMSGRLSNVVAVLGVATPNFWLGLMLIFVFAGLLGWLPSSRMGGPSHYILPVITLATAFVAGIMRLIRSSMLEELSSEYVKLARSKGVGETRVTWRHALRNSLLPALAFVGISLSGFITGAVSVETVFAWPGVGRLLYEAALGRDFPLVQGIIIVGGVMIIVLTLITDILNAWLDPRIR
jgi:peptide/nickel transport system permease protein